MSIYDMGSISCGLTSETKRCFLKKMSIFNQLPLHSWNKLLQSRPVKVSHDPASSQEDSIRAKIYKDDIQDLRRRVELLVFLMKGLVAWIGDGIGEPDGETRHCSQTGRPGDLTVRRYDCRLPNM